MALPLLAGPRRGPSVPSLDVSKPAGRIPGTVSLLALLWEVAGELDCGSATPARPPPSCSSGNPAYPGHMPGWLAHEITRTNAHRPPRSAVPAVVTRPCGPGPAAYLATVVARGTAQVTGMTDGRKRALSALAYHAGGLLEWAGADRDQVADQLVDAGIAAGLGAGISARIVNRAIRNGINRPLTPPRTRGYNAV